MFKCKYGYSIYMDCFQAGARGVDWQVIADACAKEGIIIRKKDYDNYQRGLRASNRQRLNSLNPVVYEEGASNTFFDMDYTDYPKLPEGWKESDVRFFPAEGSGAKPLKGWYWGTHLVTREQAEAISPVGMCGENLLGTTRWVADIDIDHGDAIDYDLMNWALQFKTVTQYWEARPTSYHLIFSTDRIIPTMHWPYAHIDGLGNKTNAARYHKDKVPHGEITPMTPEIWEEFKRYIKYRKDTFDKQTNT